ncbi:bifunctional DNA primase/helicase [Pseudoduganella lutea]|uniref:Bifunctional DNA primase/helicase n=2 Tax=Pseudoduganella lutea TaxID=321985 RepID=A0A4V0Z4G4_9BURK|nr:bifunctional DNA primase/helicase [Pseudoduganella lutea]
MEGLVSGDYKPLLKRKITEETARKFGYQVGEYAGKVVQLAPYYDASGTMVAQKVRFADKTFKIVGDSKAAPGLLFGQNLWNGGKKIVITEGEIDAMSVSQAQGNKWPVVSIPNGAPSAKKSLGKALEYLNGFEEVILMFDADEPGRDAAAECAELFAPGKCKIASMPSGFKDPNDLLVAGREQEIISAIWNAKSYRPDGLVNVIDLREEMKKPTEMGLPWFLEELTQLTYGRRYGEVYGFGAGTGTGKTDLFTQQIAYDRQVLGMKVGTVFLEQKPVETGKRIAGKIAGKRFHVPNAGWTIEELDSAVEKLGDQIVLYDSFGETEWDVVKNKVRFMAVSEGIRLIYLDHLTAMADTADEKGSLEQIMKEMAGLAQELDIIIHFVSHLATPEGKPHEEGGRVSIRHFKGSRAIGFWSFFMFGLERDQQAEDPVVRKTTTLRILKDRYTGQATGEVIYLAYDSETGLLSVTTAPTEASPFKDETGSKPEF